MADPTDLSSVISDAATAGVQSVTIDGNTTEATPIPDLIQADRYLASKAAAAKGRRGFKMTKIIAPAAG